MARASWYQFLGSRAEDIQAEIRWLRLEHARKMAQELHERHLAKQYGIPDADRRRGREGH